MKKNRLLLLGLLVMPLLASCTETVINLKRPYPGDPIEHKQEYEEEKNMTVNFYLDYSHSEEPIYTMKWYMLKPIGEEPAEAKKALQDHLAEHDELYPDFLGWSEYSSSLDESKLWNFETDYKQSNILSLYGIWVNKGEQRMKNTKKVLIFLPLLLLASCNFKYKYVIEGYQTAGNEDEMIEDDIDDAGSYEIKVWVDDKIVDLTRTQIQSFVSENMGKYDIKATVEPQSEGTAASSMLQDVQSGADIFVFAQDQLARLKVAGAVSKLTGGYANFIKKNNTEDSVNAATIGANVYAFPVTSDNGYFLYYDKSIISENDAKDMSTILARCSATKKKLNFEGKSNGFYTASYFLAEGINCHSIWDLDEETGRFTAYDDTFANENGFIAAKGLKELDDTNLVAGNSLASKLGDTAAAVISGIWEYDVAKNRLKDNLGCAELPSFSVDGKSYHMGSFDGYKLMGVKPQVDAKKASVCRKLAKYLTGEICQTQRFKEVAWGPTNAVSSERDDVKAHPGLAALAKQHSYATQQGQCPGAWFVSLAAAAKEIKKDSSDARIREILAVYNSELPDLLSEDQEVR